MKTKSFLLLCSAALILGCFEVDTVKNTVDKKIENIDTLTSACGTSDLLTLASQDAFSSECKEAMLSYLPQPQNTISNRLMSLGMGTIDGETVLFCSGTGPLASILTDSAAALGLYRYDSGVRSLVDTAQYVFKKMKDFNGTVVSISAILDYSGSMSDRDIDDGTTIFSDFFSLATLTDRFETDIIFFSDSVLRRMDFSSSADSISKYIARYDGFGRKNTRLFDALGTGFNDLSRRSSPIRVIIVATDGKENASTVYKTSQELYALSKSHRIPVIILGSLLADLNFMKEVSRETGGAYIYSRTILELKQKSAEIGHMFENAAGIVLDSALTKTPPDSFGLEGEGQRIVFTSLP